MHTWILYVRLRTTLLVQKSHFFSAAYSLSLIGCQRSLVIDYSLLIRLSLPKEKQPCKHHGYFCSCQKFRVWTHQHAPQTQAVFQSGSLFFELTQTQHESSKAVKSTEAQQNCLILFVISDFFQIHSKLRKASTLLVRG